MLYGLPGLPARRRRARPSAPLVVAPVGWGVRWVDAVATVGAAARAGRRRGRGSAGSCSLALVVAARRGGATRGGGCDDGRPDDRAPADRRRRVDPARRRQRPRPRARRRRRPVADGRRVRRRGRTSCGASSTPPRRRRSSPSGASSWPATSAGSPPTSVGPARRLPRRPAADAPSWCWSAAAGALAKALTDAAKAAGAAVRDTTPPTGPRDRQAWIADEAAASGVELVGRRGERRSPSGSARTSGGSTGILATLAATLRRQPRSSAPDDVEPFLGEAGGVPPWELTDAIDGGDTALALAPAGPDDRAGRAPSAAADGDPARPLRAAGPPRRCRRDRRRPRPPTRSASSRASRRRRRCSQYRRLGGGGVQRAIDLLAAADLDLRGAKDLPDDVVMDVLVARLSRLRRYVRSVAGRPSARTTGRPRSPTARMDRVRRRWR